MPVVKCDTCAKEFERLAHLEKHLARKNPCTPTEVQEREAQEKKHCCSKCDKSFRFASALSRHKTTCKGPKLEVQSVYAQNLLRKIKEMTDYIESLPTTSSQSLVLVPVGVATLLESVSGQVYLGRPGALLIAEEPFEGVLVKFGESDDMPQRVKKHENTYGGFELLDSIVTSNPRAVESKLKDYLAVNHKLVKCKSEKKTYRDIEVLAIRSQEEYVQIVRHAQLLAAEYEREVAGLTEQQQSNAHQQTLLQIEAMKLELEVIKARQGASL